MMTRVQRITFGYVVILTWCAKVMRASQVHLIDKDVSPQWYEDNYLKSWEVDGPFDVSETAVISAMKEEKLSREAAEKLIISIDKPYESTEDIESWFLTHSWSNFIEESLKLIMKHSSTHRRHKVYYSMFAGRIEYLKIHFKYTDLLLKLHIVDEVHVWDCVDQYNPGNMDFISKYIRDTEVDGYRLFRRPSNQNVISRDAATYLWGAYYKHYKNNLRYKDIDILIKADDDIVFIDLPGFKRFIHTIAKTAEITSAGRNNLHFPNIVNNDVSFLIQSKRMNSTVLNKWIRYYELFNKLQSPLDLSAGFTKYYEDISKPEPVTGKWSGTCNFPNFAYDMHKLFLQEPQHYISGTPSRLSPKAVQVKRRISINMFGGRFEFLRKLYKYLEDNCCDDEGNIGRYPTESRNQHFVHPDAVVVHFSFRAQNSMNETNKYKFLKIYDRIATEYTQLAANITYLLLNDTHHRLIEY